MNTWTMLSELTRWVEQHTLEIVGVAALASIAAFSTISRGELMTKARKREDEVIHKCVDGFVDWVEELVGAEEISRIEAQDVYRKLKRLFPIRDLFPSSAIMKEKLRQRQGTHPEANFPDKDKWKPKHMFDTKPKRVTL